MTVTDEMIEAALPIFYKTFSDSEVKLRAILKAALSTIQPMTENEIDAMLRNNDHDDTYDLVESVEYWHGIRECVNDNTIQMAARTADLGDARCRTLCVQSSL